MNVPNQTLNVIFELFGNVVRANHLRHCPDHFDRKLFPFLGLHRLQVVGDLLYVPDSLLVESYGRHSKIQFTRTVGTSPADPSVFAGAARLPGEPSLSCCS